MLAVGFRLSANVRIPSCYGGRPTCAASCQHISTPEVSCAYLAFVSCTPEVSCACLAFVSFGVLDLFDHAENPANNP